jgi:hypothetical protein
VSRVNFGAAATLARRARKTKEKIMRTKQKVIGLGVSMLSPLLGMSAQGAVVNNPIGAYPNPATNNYTAPGATQAGGFCGATSIANSFSYLQTKYPSFYPGSVLVPTSPAATRASMVGMETLTANKQGPASNATIWNSKVSYVNSVAPGSTSFAAQVSPNNPIGAFTTNANATVQSAVPTIAFLLAQLQAGEDVEIGFAGIIPGQNAPANFGTDDTPDDGDLSADTDMEEEADPLNQSQNIDQDMAEDAAEANAAAKKASFSHMVTLTGLTTGADGTTLSYLDPNNPTAIFSSAYTIDPVSNYITFNWSNGGANTAVNGTYIFEAFAESPVPEPGTMSLVLIVGASALSRRSRRRSA